MFIYIGSGQNLPKYITEVKYSSQGLKFISFFHCDTRIQSSTVVSHFRIQYGVQLDAIIFGIPEPSSELVYSMSVHTFHCYKLQ
jgi:hypothetical protein